MRLGADPVDLVDGTRARRRLRGGGRLRAAPSPLRGEQPLPTAARRGRAHRLRDVPGGAPGRGDRAGRPSLVRREPVPSGVQVAADAARAALPRFRRRGARARPRGRSRSGPPPAERLRRGTRPARDTIRAWPTTSSRAPFRVCSSSVADGLDAVRYRRPSIAVHRSVSECGIERLVAGAHAWLVAGTRFDPSCRALCLRPSLFLELAAIPSPSETNAPSPSGSAGPAGTSASRQTTPVPGSARTSGNLLRAGRADERRRNAGVPVRAPRHRRSDAADRASGEDGVVRNAAGTILGADNKAALAVMLEALRRLLVEGRPHAGIELVFTMREETGCQGASRLRRRCAPRPSRFRLRPRAPIGQVVVAAPHQRTIDVTFRGRAAHAGINPEDGRSAIVAAARAIADLRLGRLDEETTANVGTIAGGTQRNVVPERCSFTIDARSRDEASCSNSSRRRSRRSASRRLCPTAKWTRASRSSTAATALQRTTGAPTRAARRSSGRGSSRRPSRWAAVPTPTCSTVVGSLRRALERDGAHPQPRGGDFGRRPRVDGGRDALAGRCGAHDAA